MTDLLPFVKTLLTTPGLSGNEAPVREVITRAWQPLVDEITVSRLGSLHALRKGTGPEPRRRILIAAHMDTIGLIAAGSDDRIAALFPGRYYHRTGADAKEECKESRFPTVVAAPVHYAAPDDRLRYNILQSIRDFCYISRKRKNFCLKFVC